MQRSKSNQLAEKRKRLAELKLRKEILDLQAKIDTAKSFRQQSFGKSNATTMPVVSHNKEDGKTTNEESVVSRILELHTRTNGTRSSIPVARKQHEEAASNMPVARKKIRSPVKPVDVPSNKLTHTPSSITLPELGLIQPPEGGKHGVQTIMHKVAALEKDLQSQSKVVCNLGEQVSRLDLALESSIEEKLQSRIESLNVGIETSERNIVQHLIPSSIDAAICKLKDSMKATEHSLTNKIYAELGRLAAIQTSPAQRIDNGFVKKLVKDECENFDQRLNMIQANAQQSMENQQSRIQILQEENGLLKKRLSQIDELEGKLQIAVEAQVANALENWNTRQTKENKVLSTTIGALQEHNAKLQQQILKNEQTTDEKIIRANEQLTSTFDTMLSNQWNKGFSELKTIQENERLTQESILCESIKERIVADLRDEATQRDSEIPVVSSDISTSFNTQERLTEISSERKSQIVELRSLVPMNELTETKSESVSTEDANLQTLGQNPSNTIMPSTIGKSLSDSSHGKTQFKEVENTSSPDDAKLITKLLCGTNDRGLNAEPAPSSPPFNQGVGPTIGQSSLVGRSRTSSPTSTLDQAQSTNIATGIELIPTNDNGGAPKLKKEAEGSATGYIQKQGTVSTFPTVVADHTLEEESSSIVLETKEVFEVIQSTDQPMTGKTEKHVSSPGTKLLREVNDDDSSDFDDSSVGAPITENINPGKQIDDSSRQFFEEYQYVSDVESSAASCSGNETIAEVPLADVGISIKSISSETREIQLESPHRSGFVSGAQPPTMEIVHDSGEARITAAVEAIADMTVVSPCTEPGFVIDPETPTEDKALVLPIVHDADEVGITATGEAITVVSTCTEPGAPIDRTGLTEDDGTMEVPVCLDQHHMTNASLKPKPLTTKPDDFLEHFSGQDVVSFGEKATQPSNREGMITTAEASATLETNTIQAVVNMVEKGCSEVDSVDEVSESNGDEGEQSGDEDAEDEDSEEEDSEEDSEGSSESASETRDDGLVGVDKLNIADSDEVELRRRALALLGIGGSEPEASCEEIDDDDNDSSLGEGDEDSCDDSVSYHSGEEALPCSILRPSSFLREGFDWTKRPVSKESLVSFSDDVKHYDLPIVSVEDKIHLFYDKVDINRFRLEDTARKEKKANKEKLKLHTAIDSLPSFWS